MKKLTIGMATYDDFDGVYFTLQSIRFHHPEVLDRLEFVIIDNNPTSPHGQAIRDLIKWVDQPVQYLPYTKKKSTSVRNKIFDLAETEYVMSIDCHCLLEAGSLSKLLDFFDSGQDRGNLLQGPLIYDDLKSCSTHFNDTWGGLMWGQWDTDERGSNKDNPPFEIQSQGCGLFTCRKDSWLRFNDSFEGFGGEEGYIQEKYRQAGKKTMCLPFLRWMHRFARPVPPSYPNTNEGRFRNYIIGFTELQLDTTDMIRRFREVIGDEATDRVLKDTLSSINALE